MNISDVATLSKISFNPMELGAKEREYVLECVESTWISSVGRFITEFEQGIATLTGAETAIACTNGEIAGSSRARGLRHRSGRQGHLAEPG